MSPTNGISRGPVRPALDSAARVVGLVSPLLAWSGATAQAPGTSRPGHAEIVVSAAEVASRSLFSVSPVASVAFGGSADTSEVEFSQASGYHVLLPLRGGRILVLDGSRVHVVSTAAKLLRTVGRTGSGPGEYRALAGACVGAADSILLFDAALQRISVLDESASFVRSIDVSKAGAMQPRACFSDGRMLLTRTEVTADRQFEIALRIADRDGNVTGELPRQPLGAPLPEIFRGRVSVFVSDDRIYVAMGGMGTVTEIRVDGSAVRVLSLERLAPPLPESDWWRVLEARVPGGVTGAQRVAVRQRYGTLARPSTWPAFERVLPDGAGGLWVELSHTGSFREEEWLHFDRNWQLTRRLRLPRGANSGRLIVGLDSSAAYIREFDPDGFVTIARRAFLPVLAVPAR